MRYLHSIETTETSDFPAWQPVIVGDPEEYEGTAAAYGREVLFLWITDNGDENITDEYGNPLLRVCVAFADDPDALASPSNVAAVITCNQLDEPAVELGALEVARERKLYVSLLNLLADQGLEDSLRAARAADNYSANWLADFVYPAVSRPIALRMMR
ncbi:hypothetical protein ACPC54_23775 [Kitasatospora sp. NPDC094028]